MKSKVVIASLLIAAVIAVVAFFSWQSSSRKLEIIQLSTPALPELSGLHKDLSKRLQESDTLSRNGPDSLKGLQTLSRLYHANGYSEKAMRSYKGLVAVDPKNAKWPYRLAKILAEYGRLDEAAPYYERTIEIDPNYLPSYLKLADTLFKQNFFDEAESAFATVHEIDADNAYASVGLARIAIEKEDWGRARILLESAVQVSSFTIGADLLGDVYEILGLESKERIVLRSIQWGSYADIPDPWIDTLMNDSYDAYQVSMTAGWVVHEGDIQAGLKYVKRAIYLDPSNSKLEFKIAGYYQMLNNQEEAYQHYLRSTELQPEFSDAWISLIEIAKKRNSPTSLRRFLEKGLANCPNSPSLNIEMGRQLLKRGQHEKAIPYFEHAVKHRPNEAGAYIQLSTAYMNVDRIPEAMEQMKLALRAEPGNPIALTTMVFSAIAEGDQAAADEWFGKMRQQARIEESEINALSTQYQQRFGQAP